MNEFQIENKTSSMGKIASSIHSLFQYKTRRLGDRQNKKLLLSVAIIIIIINFGPFSRNRMRKNSKNYSLKQTNTTELQRD